MAVMLSANDEKLLLLRQERTYAAALDRVMSRSVPASASIWTALLHKVLREATYAGLNCPHAERVCMALFVRQLVPRIGPYMGPTIEVVEGMLAVTGSPGTARHRGLVQGLTLARWTNHLWPAWQPLLSALPELGDLHLANVTALLNARQHADLDAMMDAVLSDACQFGPVTVYKPVAMLKLRLRDEQGLPASLAVKLQRLALRLDAARLTT
jgi:hypothetical protein